MTAINFVWLFIVCHVLVDANSNQETVTIFPSSIRSERDLPNSTSTVCSLLQKRYWLPFQLYRYCRCPSGSGGCPSDWVVPGGDVTVSNTTASESILTKFGSTFSLMMNDRAQFKVNTLERITDNDQFPYFKKINQRSFEKIQYSPP